jgi:hypothetical protein
LAAVQHAELVQQECQQELGFLRQQQQQQQRSSPHPQQQQAVTTQPQLQSPTAAAAGQSSARSSRGTAEGDATSSSSSRCQGHLVLLHQDLSQCAGCSDRRVGVLVRAALQAVGRQLGL